MHISVRFKHDWRVVADSHRVKILRQDEDHWTVDINNAIHLDEGRSYKYVDLYECKAS